MEKQRGLRVSGVSENSIAMEAGISIGDILLQVNGTDIRDIIDYEYCLANDDLLFLFRDKQGEVFEIEIEGSLPEEFGFSFEADGLGHKIVCRNKCIFCFVDQMPKGMRKTLYLKDDDWRMSFLMGSYITLTNLSEAEIERIIVQRISPLYISVHAGDDDVRTKMLGTEKARDTLSIMRRLATAGINMHTQVVLCGGINDGAILQKTLDDLFDLYPAVQSVAVVPVGLSCHREGLYPLAPLDKDTAYKTVLQIAQMGKACYVETGTHFVFGADELYIRAGIDFPALESYEGFPQIENGVGMVRKFLCEVQEALDEYNGPLLTEKNVALATGVDMAPYMLKMAGWVQQSLGIQLSVYKIQNRFFGDSVTVTGLITGRDLIEQLQGRLEEDVLLLSAAMFQENTTVLLDDLTLDDVSGALSTLCKKVEVDGYRLIEQLIGEENGKTTGSDCRPA